jgi:site-specific DNA-methyltransferase (adenine-specific)
MKQIPANSIDLIVTDPPYLISYKTNHRKDKDHEFTSEIANDNNPQLIVDYIEQCYRIMKDDTAMYMFCSADKADFFKQELEKKFKIKNMIIWVKNNWSAGDLQASFGRQYEIVYLVNKGRKKINGKRLSDIWKFDRIVGNNQIHQNQKPLDLIKQCIEKHSDKGDLVFDGFGGSGTTAFASLEMDRDYFTVEYESKYCELISKRCGNIITFNTMIDEVEVPLVTSGSTSDIIRCDLCGYTAIDKDGFEAHLTRPFHQEYV